MPRFATMCSRGRRLLVATLLTATVACSQDFIVRGTIVCPEKGISDYKRSAKFALVFPDEEPQYGTITTEVGYFEIRLPNSYLRQRGEKSLTFVCSGNATTASVHRFFLGQEDFWRGERRIGELVVEQPCDSFDLSPSRARLILETIRVMDAEKKKKPKPVPAIMGYLGGGAATVGAAFLSMAKAAANAGWPNDTVITEMISLNRGTVLQPSRSAGFASRRAFSQMSQNIGFNLAPLRNLNEAAFWNPAAISLTSRTQACLQSDFSTHAMGSIIVPISEEFSLTAGALWMSLSQERFATIDSFSTKRPLESNELVALIGASKTMDKHLQFGLSVKFLRQLYDRPSSFLRKTHYENRKSVLVTYELMSSIQATRRLDLDLALHLQPWEYLRLGLTAMNVLGSELQADDQSQISQRAICAGAVIQQGRVHVGLETRLSHGLVPQIAGGINVIPLNDLSIGVGYEHSRRAYSAGLTGYGFSYTYSNASGFGEYHLFGARIAL